MGQKITNILFNNFWYKVISIIIAVTFWYVVQGEEILEINRRVLVSITVPDGYAVRGTNTRLKDATLKGPRVILGGFPKRPLEATIEIPEGKTGRLRFRIDKEYLRNWDPRVKLTVHDAYVNLFIDEKMTRTIPVKEQVRGIPGEGYIIEKTTISPSIVTITGLKTDIRKIRHVLTEPIDIDGLQQSKSIETDLLKSGIDDAEFNLDRVTVNFQVGEKKINRRFSNIPIEIIGSDYLSSVNPQYVSIQIQGTSGILNFVKTKDLQAFVEVRELKPGRFEKKIQVKIPSDTVLIETYPEHASVEIYNQKRLN